MIVDHLGKMNPSHCIAPPTPPKHLMNTHLSLNYKRVLQHQQYFLHFKRRKLEAQTW